MHEGLQKLALAALERKDWGGMAKYWVLQGCLERAEFDGELYESNLNDAWLARGQIDLVKRYAFVASQFLSKIYPGPDLVDLLEAYGYIGPARQLQDRVLTQTLPKAGDFGPNYELETHVRYLARRASPEEVLEAIRSSLQNTASTDNFPSKYQYPSYYAEIAVHECLRTKDYGRVDAWLKLDPLPFEDEIAADLWLQTRIALGELGDHLELAKETVGYVTNRGLLLAALSVPELKKSVRDRLEEFPLPSILRERFPWYEYNRSEKSIVALHVDTSLCNLLELWGRRQEIEKLIQHQECRVANVFQEGIVAIADGSTKEPPDWKIGLATLCNGIKKLQYVRYSHTDLQSAQFFVRSLGDILKPGFQIAVRLGQLLEFERIAKEDLLPALVAARIHYDYGLLSVCDLFLKQNACKILARSLLEEVERDYMGMCGFKSGGLMGLTSRYARLKDQSSAHRVLISGVRSSFTYGYRKDTAINDFIIAFEYVGVLLGERHLEVAEFLAKALIVLDELTDGRMLYDAPSHFVAILCRHDMQLAARMARILQERCRNLHVSELTLALRDHQIDAVKVRSVFSKEAPAIKFKKMDKRSNPRAYFVTSDERFFRDVSEMRSELLDQISAKDFGKAFHSLPAVIRSLIDLDNKDAAVRVFERLEEGIRARLAVYPLPDL